ncbi:hypothetical protein OIU84_010461 [Salix udensis]|uniref:Uncharacterized protein n=1 Tax=Salix udensis TaxID=889485 RepID=A0AAD6JKS6_9ROSI|nr:hypothetical protein OIU84_010461 [Salix udensis]
MRKKAATKLKNFEELRQELVLALKAKLPATSTSPPPLLSKGIQPMTEDEAHASKFFFSSPMSGMYANDCLVLHESHAQPIVQEEVAMAVAFLGSGSPLQLSSGTTTMAVSRQHDSSPPRAKENEVSPFNDVDGVVVSAKGKERVCAVSLQLQATADHGASVLGRFDSSSCITKGMDGSVLSSSSSFARKNGCDWGWVCYNGSCPHSAANDSRPWQLWLLLFSFPS